MDQTQTALTVQVMGHMALFALSELRFGCSADFGRAVLRSNESSATFAAGLWIVRGIAFAGLGMTT